MKNIGLKWNVWMLLVAVFSFALTACKGKNKDGDIQTAFAYKAQTDPNLAGVSATVAEGTVTLTGTCADENCRTNAEKTVKDIDGVKKVVNNIQVAQVQVTDDAPLRKSVEEVVSRYDGVQADVSNGIITVRGQLKRDDWMKLRPELDALRPKRVDNQLVLK
jgi:hyperosmotically inducible periplasmic protein